MNWPVVIAIAAVIVAGAVAYLLRRFVYGKIADGGGAAERAERAEQDLAVAKKQSDIMAKDRSVEDVANDLDGGRF